MWLPSSSYLSVVSNMSLLIDKGLEAKRTVSYEAGCSQYLYSPNTGSEPLTTLNIRMQNSDV